MKNFMRNTILRETHTSPSDTPPNPNSIKHRSRSKENVRPSDLNSMPDSSPSISGKPLPGAAGKNKSPLPPRPPPSNLNPLKRKLSMETMLESYLPGDSGVKVVVRIRPENKDEEGEMTVKKVSNNSLLINGQTFTFDSVADTEATQLDIFQLVGGPLVENCLAGFNSSVFAYGQTGSGKTYTMWGPANALLEENLSSDQQGLTPRVFERLFARINEEQIKHSDKQLKYQCRCSFLEIYNEQITDLLDPSQKNLQLREDVKSGIYVENLTEDCVCTMKDVTRLLIKGLSNRRTGATSINADSSRSHSVFTCVVESRCKSTADGISSFKTSRINLVDLAGSERQKLTGAAGERLKEAGNINRSLSQLGNLINILAEVSQTGRQRHIPYRDSRLTFLLQESLGGNAKLAMICAISPAQSCKSETFSTLRFAQRAKAIKNKAVVNEVMQDDVNFLREVIKQLKDELLRMKANGNSSDLNGGYSTGWNARRSLNLLKFSLNRSMALPHLDDDGDEVMEIDEEAIEKICAQSDSQHVSSKEGVVGGPQLSVIPIDEQSSEVTEVDMEEGLPEEADKHENMIVDSEKPGTNEPDCSEGNMNSHCNQVEGKDKHEVDVVVSVLDVDKLSQPSEEIKILISSDDKLSQPSEEIKVLISSDDKVSNEESPNKQGTDDHTCLSNSANISNNYASASNLSIVPSDVSPVLKSPTPSVSPKVNNSRKSLRTSSMLSASQKDLINDSNFCQNSVHISFGKSKEGKASNALAVQASKNSIAPTEHLAASLHRGLEIIQSHSKSSALRQSSFRFSLKPVDYRPTLAVDKVNVGVQTLPQENEIPDDSPMSYLCSNCKTRTHQLELGEVNDNSSLQLVPIDGSEVAEKSKQQVPKAVEKVLAGAIRREMALEEFSAKQTAEIMQLSRLVQQYRHERECNAIIGQTREDKIIRLESLMDGVLPTEEFMEEEFLSLKNEHMLLRDKYENHPEVLRQKIELKRVQDELEQYRNFCDMGERDVLLEEIQDLRSQLQYYLGSSAMSARKRSLPLQLAYSCERSMAPPLCKIPESTEVCVVEKFEQERLRWTEAESNWISLAEELRSELDASRSQANKWKQELDSEKTCAEELKEAMQMAMEGHARMLEQYADLEEKHMALLLRHRKILEGIDDVKKAAVRAGVRGAESKFINALAAEISALKVEREKERRYFRDENRGLQAQLRDTAEAVQAAGELLVRLKEAEEAIAAAQKRAIEAEHETEKAHKQIDKLKKKLEREPEGAGDQKWKVEFEPFYKDEDGDLSKLAEPSAWFSGYDRCNI